MTAGNPVIRFKRAVDAVDAAETLDLQDPRRAVRSADLNELLTTAVGSPPFREPHGEEFVQFKRRHVGPGELQDVGHRPVDFEREAPTAVALSNGELLPERPRRSRAKTF